MEPDQLPGSRVSGFLQLPGSGYPVPDKPNSRTIKVKRNQPKTSGSHATLSIDTSSFQVVHGSGEHGSGDDRLHLQDGRIRRQAPVRPLGVGNFLLLLRQFRFTADSDRSELRYKVSMK